jgi:hypothetical protein
MARVVIDDDVRRLLDGPNVAHVATLMHDGSPHVVPVWVARDGDLVRLVEIGGSVGLRNRFDQIRYPAHSASVGWWMVRVTPAISSAAV